MKEYAVIYEKGNNVWGAYVPDLPGCTSMGDTLDDVKQNIQEAITGYIKNLREYGEPVPEPASVAGIVQIAA